MTKVILLIINPLVLHSKIKSYKKLKLVGGAFAGKHWT